MTDKIPDDVMEAARNVYAQLPEMDFDISGTGATNLIARALRAVQQVGGGQIIKIEADGSITVLPPAAEKMWGKAK